MGKMKGKKKSDNGSRQKWKGKTGTLGKSSSGHGFALDRKSKMIKKYKKFSKGAGEKSYDANIIKPLAFDPFRDGKPTEESMDQEECEPSRGGKVSEQVSGFKKNKMKSVQMEYKKQVEARKQAAEERKAQTREHRERVRKGIERRQKAAQKLMKRTKKGQPILSNHISHLLEKIKSG